MLKLTLVGGATGILNYAGLCWLTDPSLSPPGEHAGGLVKTTGPAIESAALPPIDVVLVSHEHHRCAPRTRLHALCRRRGVSCAAADSRV
jgi:L-ascorbate metabolism protein UlaG (beta-lactamase superfamily)